VLGAEGLVVPGSEAAGDDGGGEDAGGEEAGGDDAGGDDAGGEDAGGEDAGGDDAGGEDAGGEEAGGDDAGGDDAGGEDAGGLPELEDPVVPPEDWVTIGVGGSDVPVILDEAGLRNALGDNGIDAEGEDEDEDEDDAPGLADGLDAEAGRVAAAPAPVCGWRWLPSGARFAPIRAKAATAEPATSPPVRIAEASVRETRCRPGRLVPPRGGSPDRGGWPELSVSAISLLASAGPRAAAADRSRTKLLMMDSASQPGAGWRAPTSASISRAVGRSPGCLARHLPTSGRSSPGTSPSLAGLLTSRYMSAAFDPAPKGPCPVAAKVRTAPRLNMSLAGPISAPRTCSGDM
jgi:hypothetical protein